jgi:hypothetical protein
MQLAKGNSLAFEPGTRWSYNEPMTTPKPEVKSPAFGYGFGVDTETGIVGHSPHTRIPSL